MPVIDPEIHYRVYKASYRARRSIILFTMPVIDPEDSSPCLQSLFWSQKICYHVHRSCYGSRRLITVFTKPPIEPEDPLLCLQCLLLK